MINKTIQIYKSSAGSGKTYTLVREYLVHALAHPEKYRNILAITFTNKAAAEMKGRIIEALIDLMDGKKEDLATQILEEASFPAGELRDRAEKLLGLILHDYGNFGVSTIDSFTHRIVRNFSHDLDLPSRFDVELDQKSMITKMTDQLMDQIGTDPYITDILIKFAEEKLADKGNWNLDADLIEVGQELFRPEAEVNIEALHAQGQDNMKEFIDFLKAQKEVYPEFMHETAGFMLKLAEKAGLSYADFKSGRSNLLKNIRSIASAKSPKQFEDAWNVGFTKATRGEGKWATRVSPELQSLIEGEFGDIAAELYDYHQKHFDAYNTAYQAFEHIHSLAVIREVEELMELYKSENSLVHISDFQKKIAEFIKQESPEYLYWRLGEKYRYFLLDEFQDTSLLQWQNLLPLFENLLAEAEPDGTVLLVGDSKQAIYRWRGGEVELLEFIAPAQLEAEPLDLDTNWRSDEVVVNFNNQFFSSLAQLLSGNELLNKIYSDFHQNTAPGKEGAGFVRLKGFPGRSLFDPSMEETLATIQSLQQDGFRLSDIAILIRNRAEGTKIARELTANGIPVISSEALLIFREPVIGFLNSCLRYLVNSQDDLARAEMIHYHLFYKDPELLKDDLVFELTEEIQPEIFRNSRKFREVLNAEKKYEALNAILPEEFRKLYYKLSRMPLYEVVEELIRIFELADESRVYLAHYLDIILDFSEKQRGDIEAFIHYWDEKKESFSLSVPEGIDAVEIITIHKAKGLEYPVVILPLANWRVEPKNGSLFWAGSQEAFGAEHPDRFLVPVSKSLDQSKFRDAFDEEKEKAMVDSVNLLYVATTRAKNRLYIHYSTKNEQKNWTSPEKVNFEKVSGIHDLIAAILNSEMSDQGSEVSDAFEMGFEEPYTPKPGEGNNNPASKLLSVPWRNRIRIERKHNKDWGWRSGADLQDTQPAIDALATTVFESLKNPEDLSLVLKDMVESGLMSGKDTMNLRIKIERMLGYEPLKTWFSDQVTVRKESSILTAEGELYKPGRLMLEGQKAIIVDFSCEEDVSEFRSNQEEYAATLAEMGYDPIEKFIVDVALENVLD